MWLSLSLLIVVKRNIAKSQYFLVHGTVVVHGTVKSVVHGTVKFEFVVHGTVMVHGTVQNGAWDGHFFGRISLFLLFDRSWHVGACVSPYYRAVFT